MTTKPLYLRKLGISRNWNEVQGTFGLLEAMKFDLRKLTYFASFIFPLAESGMIPGNGCGLNHPLKLVADLGPEDDINDMPCTLVHSQKSFQKYFAEKSPGQF